MEIRTQLLCFFVWEKKRATRIIFHQCHKFMKCYEFFSTVDSVVTVNHIVWHTIKHITLFIATEWRRNFLIIVTHFCLLFLLPVITYEFLFICHFILYFFILSYRDIPEDVLNTYCWIHSTYTVVDAFMKKQGAEVPFPGVDNSLSRGQLTIKHTKYYQWVAFTLFFQVSEVFWSFRGHKEMGWCDVYLFSMFSCIMKYFC